jgi:hypothetical protein
VDGGADIWLGVASRSRICIASSTVVAGIGRSRCELPSTRVSVRAWVKITSSPSTISVVGAGSTRSRGVSSIPAAASADPTSVPKVCTIRS